MKITEETTLGEALNVLRFGNCGINPAFLSWKFKEFGDLTWDDIVEGRFKRAPRKK